MTSQQEAKGQAALAASVTGASPPADAAIAVVPGSYDPVTLGHLDVIHRAGLLFDQVKVVVAGNQDKRPLFDLPTRVELVQASLPDESRFEVVAITGLLADYCRQVGARAIVKGLRGGADLTHEEPMALVNRDLAGIETLFLPASPAFGFVSSSVVRDLARHGGDVSPYVTKPVQAALQAAFGL
ncbi:MAG: pantetheine-phosphate adenylyltransferase [Micrococcales bacterium]|nr:pantetheine-phosphate adenylyltransferase [Micrococcales bacterium]